MEKKFLSAESAAGSVSTVDTNREHFHRKIGRIIGNTAEMSLDTGIGAAKIGTYGIARAIRGLFEVKNAAQRGFKGERYSKGN